jgi:hypothetical protein
MTAQGETVEFSAFDNSYARLPDRFFERLRPTPVAAPRLIRLNVKLALDLGLDPEKLAAPEGVEILAGNRVPKGGEPLAMAYAGHQFGTFVPQLGDGRAILLGEVIDRAGVRRDIQLKGAGPTPYSRRGDGRAALGPVLREYIVSEAMAALGIPTTRALAAVTTGEPVWRETALPGAVPTRVASSHIRVGTFQFFAVRRDVDAIRRLADHVIARHYPDAAGAANRYRALLDQVIARQAIHASSAAVSPEHWRAITDRLDTKLLKRAFVGWLRGERDHCKMAAIPSLREEAPGSCSTRARCKAALLVEPAGELQGARSARIRRLRSVGRQARGGAERGNASDVRDRRLGGDGRAGPGGRAFLSAASKTARASASPLFRHFRNKPFVANGARCRASTA